MSILVILTISYREYSAELPEVLRSEPELDASTCLQIADRLRHVAACVDRGTEFGADDYHCLETFVHVLQKGA